MSSVAAGPRIMVNLPASRGCGDLLEDLGSRNGTFVNGERIRDATAVSPADVVTLGRTVPLPWPQSKGIAVPPAAIRIGRGPDNDVVLDYPMVSACHARIVSSEGENWLEDLGSTWPVARSLLGLRGSARHGR